LKICIDVSAAVHRRAGLGRYTQELVRALVAQGGHDYIAFYHQRGQAHLDPPVDALPQLTTPLSVKPWRLAAMLAHFTGVPQDAMFPGIDLWHATEHLAPRLRRIRSVFTLHDLIFRFDPGSHLPLNRIYLNTMMPRFLRAADAVIAVSECSKRDAVHLYNTPAEKIHVIPEGVDAHFRPVRDRARLAQVREQYGLPDHFVLFVGTIEPRKNLPVLFEALASRRARGLDMWPLVIVGKPGWLVEPILARITELGLQDWVYRTGFVPDDDLPALYSAATVSVMPSRYEGFGLPVLEAMACGTPVVCSNTSSLPEVAGQAALLVAPEDVPGWADTVTRVWNDAALYGKLRERGLAQAAQFTWENAARQTLEVYRTVVGQTTSIAPVPAV
jgi:glycosyltransferase involved in cell wall biosynthesis